MQKRKYRSASSDMAIRRVVSSFRGRFLSAVSISEMVSAFGGQLVHRRIFTMENKLSKESRKVPATPGLFSTLTSFLLVLLFSTWVVAESPQPAATHPLTNQEDAIPAVTPLSKVSSDLLKMRTLSQGPDAGQSLKNILPETKNWIVYQDGNPVLEFYLNTTDEKRVNEVVFHLQSLGCSIKGVYGRYGRIYGTCDLNLLDQIAANDAISLFRVATSLAFDPRSQTGAF